MRPAAFITGITGMVVVVGLLMAGEARLGGGTADEETASAGETETAPANAAPDAEQARDDVGRPCRNDCSLGRTGGPTRSRPGRRGDIQTGRSAATSGDGDRENGRSDDEKGDGAGAA